MSRSLFVVGFPWEVLCDESVSGLELDGVVAERAVRVVFPSISDEGDVGAPLVPGLPEGLVWGAGVEVGGVVIGRVTAEVPGLAGGAPVENFIGEIAAFRKRWMLWIGVLSGQTTSTRWAAVTELRDREGIRLVNTTASGETVLLASSMITWSFLRPGAEIGVLCMSARLIQAAWDRAIAGEEPPFAVELFHMAREAVQQRQARAAMLELGSAVEMLLWERYKNLAEVTEEKKWELGRLARELSKVGGIEMSPASGVRALIDLRNNVVHHPERGVYRSGCVRAFKTALELFRQEHPDLFELPSSEGPHLIGQLDD